MKKIKLMLMLIFTVLFSGLFIVGCIEDHSTEPDPEEPESLHGKVIILQAYGNEGDDSPAGVSHSFVELYNKSNKAIKLDEIGLYYANGTTVASDATPNTATKDSAWKRISLNGKTIPAKGSFLILGAKHSDLSSTRYTIADGYGDINDNNLSLSRRAFKVALIQSTENITVQNPFTANSGKPIKGYIDMVGAANEYQSQDLIFGFETAPARNSASQAVRRADLTDTDDNSTDFIAARYASGGMSDELLEVRKPRNSGVGKWNPFATPEYGEGSPMLMILQIGASADDSNNVSHTFVELYNNTSQAITLNGAYSLQYAEGTKVVSGAVEDLEWEKIDLTGTIQPYHSFLILGAKRSTNNTPGLKIEDNSGDMNETGFKLSNRAGKVVLMNNQTLLSVQNPLLIIAVSR